MNGHLLTKTIDKIKNDKFLSNSFIFFTGSFLVSLGGFLFHFLMARMLSIKDYGELQSLIAISVIIGIPATTILTVLVKYVAHFKAKGELGKVHSLFSFFTKKIFIIAIGSFLIFSLFSNIIADFLNLSSIWPVIILGLSLMSGFLIPVNSGIIRGLQKFKSASIIPIIAIFFKILMAVIFVKLSFGINGVMGAVVLSGIIGYLITFIPLKFLFKKEKQEFEKKEIFKYFSPVFFTLLFTGLLYNLDMILVKHFFSPAVAGQYGALILIGHIVFFLGSPIAGVMFPAVATAYSNNGNHLRVFKKSIILVVLLGVGVSAFYFLFPEFVIKTLVGSKFLSISEYLGWFGFSMLLYSLVVLFSQYLLSIDKTKYFWLMGSGVLLQTFLFCIWHDNLWQIVWIMNGVMLFVLILLIFYFLKIITKKCPIN